MKNVPNRQKPVVRANEIWQKFALKRQQVTTLRERQRRSEVLRKEKQQAAARRPDSA